MKKLSFVLMVFLILISFAVLANAELASVDLSMLTKDQLTVLLSDIEEEIELNHTIGSRKNRVQDAVENAVETYYLRKNIDVSWAIFDDEYTRDWDFYTYENEMTYYDGSGKKRREKVYAELQYVDYETKVFYITVGKEVIMDNRSEMPETKWSSAPEGVFNKAANLDLSKASVEELKNLKKQIEKEIKANHSPNSSGKKQCLEVTKNAVTEYLAHLNVKLSWPWFDYSYTCDWDYYTLTTSVEYESDTVNKTGVKVYSETYPTNGKMQIVMLMINDEIVIDRRSELTASDPVKKMVTTALLPPIYHLDDYEVGEVFTCGVYEQDNILENGKEPIEWVVLSKDNNSILVISKYTLDSKQFHDGESGRPWCEASIRTWLNDDFLNSVFSEDEKASIRSTYLFHKNEYRKDGAINTTDRVFLLSEYEVQGYILDNSDLPYGVRSGKPTHYAEEERLVGMNWNEDYWWLRSPGFLGPSVYNFSFDQIHDKGLSAGSYRIGVRPAMCLFIDRDGSKEADGSVMPNYNSTVD